MKTVLGPDGKMAVGLANNSQLHVISVLPADGWSAVYVYGQAKPKRAVAVRLIAWALAEDDASESDGLIRQQIVGIDAVTGDVGATGFRFDLPDDCKFVRYLSPSENEQDVLREVEEWENRS